LSRLFAIEARDILQDNKLNNIYAFSEVHISNNFKGKLRARYTTNAHFARISRLLSFPDKLPEGDFALKVHSINFEIKNSLLYYMPLSKPPRLCILNACTKTLLFIIYNSYHFGFDCTYDKLCGFCIPRLTKKVL
jgi:hypothetical protein